MISEPCPDPASSCRQCGGSLGPSIAGSICPRCEFAAALAPVSAPEGVVPEGAARRFGDYELIEEIAHGGMGVVYRARHVKLDRVVALKMLLLGQFASDLAVKRFQREAAAAAALRHPGIVSVFEVGECDGQHYFTMEMVEGRSLASLLQSGPLPPHLAAVYLKALAEAVAHAHAQGIVHRDLKPSNILIDLFDTPRITDFGLARRLDGTGDLTLTGHILGSPNYLAPELLDGRRTGTRSTEGVEVPGAGASAPPIEGGSALTDLFSLGAVLYECLTGRAPFLGATLEETLLRVRDTDPVSPRLLQARVPRDLETICLKCLEKDPFRRYESAAELAQELGRFLDGHPISARPISPMGRGWRWARRRPAMATLVVALHVVAALGLAGILWQWRRAETEAGRAGQAEREIRNQLVRQWVATGNELGGQGRVLEALPWYLQALRDEPEPERREVHRRRLHASLLTAPRSEHVWFHSNAVNLVRLSPDERWVASCSEDETARVWDLESGQPLTPPLRHPEAVRGVEFSPDGRFLLSFGSRRLHRPGLGPEGGQGSLRLWALPEGREMWAFDATNTISTAEWSLDGRRIAASCTDGKARVWTVQPNGNSVSLALEWEFEHPAENRSAAFSPDGTRLATGARDSRFRVWDLRTGRPVHDLEGPPSGTSLRTWDRRWVALFSPDGKQLAGYRDFSVRVWEAESGRPLFDLNPDREVNAVAYHPKSQSLITSSRGGQVEIWSATNGVRSLVINANEFWTSTAETTRAEYGADGRTILVWDREGLRFHRPEQGLARAPFLPSVPVASARVTEDGRRVVVGDREGGVWVWNFVPVRATGVAPDLTSVGNAVSFSPDGRRLVAGDLSSGLGVWDATTLRSRIEAPHFQTPGRWGIHQILSTPDGRRFLATDNGGTMRLYEYDSGRPVSPLWTNSPGLRVCAAFLPDGRQVVTGDDEGVIRRIRLEDGVCLAVATQTAGLPVREVLVPADGRFVVTLANDRRAVVRDPVTLEPRGEPMAIGGPVHSGQISPDGTLLLTGCSSEGQPRVWDLPKGTLRWSLDFTPGMQSVTFSPDGRWIAVCGSVGGLRIWNAATGQLQRAINLGWDAHHLKFSPNGRWLAVTGTQGVRVWEVPTFESVTPVWMVDPDFGFANKIDWSPDSTRLAAVGSEYPVRIWSLEPGPYSDADWEDLATGISGRRLDGSGRLVAVQPHELRTARTRALTRNPAEFTPPLEWNVEFLWRQRQFGTWPALERSLRTHLDQAIQRESPDSPEGGRSEMRHRRALLRLTSGDALGAAEDKPSLGGPDRDGVHNPHQIDLRKFYNNGLGTWGFGNPGLHLGDLTSGPHTFEGVRFDVGGIVTLDAMNPDRGRNRARIMGIPVGVRGTTLHVLQGANFDAADGVPVGDIVLHYADGETRRVEVVYGRDTRNWWTVSGEPLDTPRARVVWRGQCPYAMATGQNLRLYLTSFSNPRPEVEVRSLDLVSAMNRAGFFIVAMTFE
ncbi:MAG: protein kinase [Verrucomicrobiales bacterium]|nr:protein kinase [Verrucomicrobiales bacterium]